MQVKGDRFAAHARTAHSGGEAGAVEDDDRDLAGLRPSTSSERTREIHGRSILSASRGAT